MIALVQPIGLPLIVQDGKNFNIAIFLDTINVMIVKLCMIVTLAELYLSIALSVTLMSQQCQRVLTENFMFFSD